MAIRFIHPFIHSPSSVPPPPAAPPLPADSSESSFSVGSCMHAGMLEAGPPKGSQGLAPLMPPGVSRHCLDFLKRLLTYDPEIRVTARDALRHPYFLKYRREQQQQEMLRQER
eukprot:GHVU01226929.1.p2 GENE.GHVU01226929.1~~GHVU01226929.1.p2  ORF type:complete len:113 (-),score=15.34 GHVU01226929.1:136-474(-)